MIHSSSLTPKGWRKARKIQAKIDRREKMKKTTDDWKKKFHPMPESSLRIQKKWTKATLDDLQAGKKNKKCVHNDAECKKADKKHFDFHWKVETDLQKKLAKKDAEGKRVLEGLKKEIEKIFVWHANYDIELSKYLLNLRKEVNTKISEAVKEIEREG